MNRLQNTFGDLVARVKYIEDIVLYNKKKDKNGKSKKVVNTENSDEEAPAILNAEEGRTVFDEIIDRIINSEISYKQKLSMVQDSHANHVTEVEDRLFGQETNIQGCLSV